ncbi:unnamed protein product [Sympodiomycopsis kandeliae]
MSSQWTSVSQSQAVPPPPSQATQSASQGLTTSPPPRPPENDDFVNPILQNGSGLLNGLDAQFHLSDDAFYIVSSSYRPAPQKPSSGGKKSNKRSTRNSSDGSDDVGLWQIRVAKMVFGDVDWYTTELDGQLKDGRVSALMTRSNCASWDQLQQRVYDSFNANEINFGVLKKHRQDGGSWSQLELIFGNDSDPDPPIRLSLLRCSHQDSLVLSTYLCAELCKQNTIQKHTLADRLAKLQHARRLAGTLSTTSQSHASNPMASQGGGGNNSTSLVNPGRIKRQRNDDQGFEDDDESSSGGEQEVQDNRGQGTKAEEEKEEEQLITVGSRTRNTADDDASDAKRQKRELSQSQADEE